MDKLKSNYNESSIDNYLGMKCLCLMLKRMNLITQQEYEKCIDTLFKAYN